MKRIFTLLLTVVLLLGAVGCGNTEEKWQEQYDLGVRYLSEGSYEEAILAFTAAIEIDPKRPEAYMELSGVYQNMGDIEKAIEVLEKGAEATDSAELAERLEQLRAEAPLLQEISAEGTNQYGGTPFILREHYTPYAELSAEEQEFLTTVIAAIKSDDRETLLSVAEQGERLLEERGVSEWYQEFFTFVDQYKVGMKKDDAGYGGVDTETGAHKAPGWIIQIRPEQGTGYYATVYHARVVDMSKVDPGNYTKWCKSTDIRECPCENWQWNGTLHAKEICKWERVIDGQYDYLLSQESVIGTMANSLREGIFEYHRTIERTDSELNSDHHWTETYEEGHCIAVSEEGIGRTVNDQTFITINDSGYGYSEDDHLLKNVLYW